MEEQEKKKRLNLMRFWLLGTFIIVFAALTAYISLYNGQDFLWAISLGLPIWGIVGVAALLFYFGYDFLYLRKQ